jgi:alpha-L-fucosidase
MKLGIYYSHCLDWSDPDGADPGPDSGKNFGMSWGNDWDFPDYQSKDFSRYFEQKAIPQIKELLTEYGPVFLMWFDCPLQITREQCQALQSMVKELQPNCLINSRIGHNMGDFGSLGDNQMPVGQTEFPLESANTLNHTWGYKKDDHCWSDAKTLIGNLLATNEKDVNYLLNVGPRPDGKFPEASIDVLDEVAKWRHKHGVDIQNTRPNPFPQSFPWGWCTVNGNVLQFFVGDSRKEICISGLRSKIVSCNFPFEQDADGIRIKITGIDNGLPKVVKAEFAGILDVDPVLTPQDGVLILSPGHGEIIHGQNCRVGDSDIKFGPAAEIITEDGTCSINESGALTQWHHPGDGLCWQVSFPQAGHYKVKIVTVSRCHSRAWVGNRTVKLEFAGQKLIHELCADDKLGTSYYAGAASEIGTIEVAANTKDFLNLSCMNISSANAIDMNLTEIRLYLKLKEE